MITEPGRSGQRVKLPPSSTISTRSLIDQGRTPLIISGQPTTTDVCHPHPRRRALTRQIGEANPRTGWGAGVPGDFSWTKAQSDHLTEKKRSRNGPTLKRDQVPVLLVEVGRRLTLLTRATSRLMHHPQRRPARWSTLYHRDAAALRVVQRRRRAVIVDEFTGRLYARVAAGLTVCARQSRRAARKATGNPA